MSHELIGQIKCIKRKNEENNMYVYTIKNIEDNTVNDYTYWGDNEGNIKDGLDNLYELKIKYNSKINGKWTNNEIKSVEYGAIITDMSAINDLLLNKIGFTKIFADKIVDKYGKNTIKILLTKPEKIKNIEHRSLETQLKKLSIFTQNQTKREIMCFLALYGIKSKDHNKIINYYDSNLDKLKSAIYDMCIELDISFIKCDIMALKNEYDIDDLNRLIAFIKFMYKKENKNGKLYLSYEEIQFFCNMNNIKISTKLVLKYLVQINYEGQLYYTSESIYKKENKIKKICDILRKKKPNIIIDYKGESDIESKLDDKSQRNAKKIALCNSISIITGGAGTGKTYTVAGICRKLLEENVLIYILAPTGAAVERVKSSTGIKEIKKNNVHSLRIKTIHSFINTNKRGFVHGNCKKCDKNKSTVKCECIDQPVNSIINNYKEIIFFIDEMSMVALDLFYDFIKIINNQINNIRLILIGDKNQLPSIDGGTVLNDLIQYKKIKCIELNISHRQRYGRSIFKNAQLVLEGKDIVPDDIELQFIETDYEKSLKTLDFIIVQLLLQ